jgi:hypothetical protein
MTPVDIRQLLTVGDVFLVQGDEWIITERSGNDLRAVLYASLPGTANPGETPEAYRLREALEDASRRVKASPSWLKSIYDQNRAIVAQIRAENAPVNPSGRESSHHHPRTG